MDSRPLKYTITHHRNPNVTHDEFMHYVVEVHLRRAMPLFKKYGALKYAVFESPLHLNNAVKAKVSPLRPGWEFADFDCCIEYLIPDMQAIENVMSDPDWLEAIKDQDDFVDMSRALVTIGYETVYLSETGEVVNMATD